MVSRELEFRGINLNHLKLYFEELGGIPLTDQFPYIYRGESWRGEIGSEGELTFTPAFKVNVVKIRFTADSESELTEIIRKYRLKTTRIGG